MSPARARTSSAEIIAAARELLEAGGLGELTMQAVAARVGVRAPSLYKRFPSRGALIAAVASATLDELGERLAPFGRYPDPASGLRELAWAYRAFAQRDPRAFELLYLNLPPDERPPVDHIARAAGSVLSLTERFVGPEHALEAARLITAFANGFITMEAAGAFRLGGDTDRSYRYGVDSIVEALARERGAVHRRRAPRSR